MFSVFVGRRMFLKSNEIGERSFFGMNRIGSSFEEEALV